MNGLSLQSYTPPGDYELDATFEGLLELERYGFYICRRKGEGNGEFFTTMKPAELHQMWQSLQSVTRERLWVDRHAHFSAWNAAYLLTATGHIPNVGASDNLAGVIFPANQPLSDRRDGSIRWYFRIGLARNPHRLPLAARELIALSQQRRGQEWYRFYQSWQGTVEGTYPIQRLHYRYINSDWQIFTCVADTLEKARAQRDNWLADIGYSSPRRNYGKAAVPLISQ